MNAERVSNICLRKKVVLFIYLILLTRIFFCQSTMLLIFQYSFFINCFYSINFRKFLQFQSQLVCCEFDIKFIMLATQNTGQKRKVPKDQVKYRLYSSINDRSHMLGLRPGYQIYPSAAEIFERKFIINNLIIKNMSTKAQWKGTINLKNLKAPLYQLIDLGRTYIEVYPNQQQKPMAGTELNRVCFVTFSNFKNLSKRKLKKICQTNECELLSMNSSQFTVQIPHFSKYSFEGQHSDSDNEQEKKQWQQIKKAQNDTRQQGSYKKKQIDSITNQLKTLHAQRLVQQKQQVRKTMHVSFVEGVKNTLPSQKLKREVFSHNQQNGHQTTETRMAGTPTTVGVNCNVSTYIHSTNLHFLLFNPPKQHKTDLLNLALNLIKDQSQITNYIFAPQAELSTQRILTLNVICFKFDQCYFGFEMRQSGLELIRLNHPPEPHYRSKYFKSWFQWAINKDKQTFKIENQMIRALVFRKTSEQAEKCLKFNQYDDSQFLTSIEDESYRFGEPPRNLCRELRAISIGDMSYFSHLPWLVRFGVGLWYFSFKQNAEERLKQILNSDYSSHHSLERHILSIFLKIPFNSEVLTSLQESDHPLWFYIENSNNNDQVSINAIENPFFANKNTKNKRILSEIQLVRQDYKNYRFNLAWQIVDTFGNSEVALQVATQEKFLSKDEKINLLRNFINKYIEQAQRIPPENWGEYSDLIHIARAEAHYSNRDYLRSLECFAKCNLVSGAALEVLKIIAQKQEIICGFHRKTIQKTRKLLQKIKTPDNDLACTIMFLSTTLGKQNLDSNKVLSMIKMCYRIPNHFHRTKMLQIVFKEAIKNPTVIADLKRNPEFYKKMQEVYIDNSYLLQLKLVRLEL